MWLLFITLVDHCARILCGVIVLPFSFPVRLVDALWESGAAPVGLLQAINECGPLCQAPRDVMNLVTSAPWDHVFHGVGRVVAFNTVVVLYYVAPLLRIFAGLLISAGFMVYMCAQSTASVVALVAAALMRRHPLASTAALLLHVTLALRRLWRNCERVSP